MRSRSWDGEATDSANPAERGGAGARLLLLFAHSFAEGEAGVGLDWTPLAPLSTPWAMGAGEKNGIWTGEEEGEKRFYGASTWSHPSARDAPKCCPLRWARLDLGRGHGAGRAQ